MLSEGRSGPFSLRAVVCHVSSSLASWVAGVNECKEEFIGGIGCSRDAVVPFKVKNLGLHEIETYIPVRCEFSPAFNPTRK